jgi:hypothetical protein
MPDTRPPICFLFGPFYPAYKGGVGLGNPVYSRRIPDGGDFPADSAVFRGTSASEILPAKALEGNSGPQQAFVSGENPPNLIRVRLNPSGHGSHPSCPCHEGSANRGRRRASRCF